MFEGLVGEKADPCVRNDSKHSWKVSAIKTVETFFTVSCLKNLQTSFSEK